MPHEDTLGVSTALTLLRASGALSQGLGLCIPDTVQLEFGHILGTPPKFGTCILQLQFSKLILGFP